MWGELYRLSALEGFIDFYKNFYDELTLKGFKNIYDEAEPHRMPLPGDLDQ